jgi:hypothetical protein
MRKRARESICPGDYCEDSKSSAIEHGMTSSPSTSLGFTWTQIINSSGYDEMKSSRKRTTHNSIEKNSCSWSFGIRTSSIWSRFSTKVASSTPVIRSLRYSSHCPNGAQLKQRATRKNCWCVRTMRAHIPPTYQLNIWMKIEWNRRHILHTPDLAPSDFSFFRDVKRCLAGLSFEDGDQFLASVKGVLEGIEKVTLQAVFLEWMERLRKCIAPNGEHIEKAQINVIEEWSFILPILRCSCPGGTPCP